MGLLEIQLVVAILDLARSAEHLIDEDRQHCREHDLDQEHLPERVKGESHVGERPDLTYQTGSSLPGYSSFSEDTWKSVPR